MNEEIIKNNKGGVKILLVILLVLIIIAGILLGMKVWKNEKETEPIANQNDIIENTEIEQKEEKNPVTFVGNERPIAIMIDNNINAMPQAGLLEADLVYEIIVEGGETRLMAIIKNKDLDKIGPIRSARHYFLDYALENDAIYVHFGESPQAKDDIITLGISDINGINESSSSFWRESSRYAPHNVLTSTQKIQKIAERKEFRTTSSKKSVLNYVAEEIELESEIEENNKSSETTKITNLANTITIPYSDNNTVKYTYNEKTKTYIRYSRDKKQVDWYTNKDVTTKNIIITKCENTILNDGSTTGRQTLNNIKTLDGYYITNGKYIPIKCEKTSRSGQTVYKDLQGNEIKVNDGKTFIQICPIDSKINFE